MRFCTFNRLMVTVLALRADGFTRRIGILDLDEHYDPLSRGPLSDAHLLERYQTPHGAVTTSFAARSRGAAASRGDNGPAEVR